MTPFHKALIIVIAILAGLSWFFVQVSSILLPFILAFILAYFLHPGVMVLQKQNLPRWLATGIVTALFCLSFIAIILVLLPILRVQGVALISKIPSALDILWGHIQELLEYTKENIPQAHVEEISAAISAWFLSLFNNLGQKAMKLLTEGIVIFNMISLILITPIVLFYVLRDWQSVEKKVNDLVPEMKKEQVGNVLSEINQILSGFIRGQLSVCLLLGLFYGVGLSAVGLDFGLLVGLIAGILSFIPYFGFLTGVLLSILLGLVSHISINMWMGVAGVFLVGQILESYILTPKLVGDKVGLHPGWVIFALLAGGAMFGFVGILVAVPVAGVLGVFVRHIFAWYKNSPVYKKYDHHTQKKHD